MEAAAFLRTTPRELDSLMGMIGERERRHFIAFALVCSVIANVNRDPKERDEPYTIDDFLPGAQSEEEKLIEWYELMEKIERGEADPEHNPEAMETFKRQMKKIFRGANSGGEVTTTGPKGKAEKI
jgi:hypothetical protein